MKPANALPKGMPAEEDGHGAWLRRARLGGSPKANKLRRVWRESLGSGTITLLSGAYGTSVTPDPILDTALGELQRGLRELLGMGATVARGSEKALDAPGLVLGSFSELGLECPLPGTKIKSAEAYALVCRTTPEGKKSILLAADHPKGFLYGIFCLLECIDLRKEPDGLALYEAPANSLRMLDHWDNMDGSIERGYAGRSLFFDRNCIRSSRSDLKRIAAYARLLASTGINAIAINNVNVHGTETGLVLDPLLPQVAGLADIFRPWGIRLFLSANYASPLHTGDLSTADPLDPAVGAWWAKRAQALYGAIPDFGGFVVKADSEGRPGPFTYHRSHADGANMLARALEPWGGLVVWRCFVYNCKQDWRDRKTDRARAAWDHFMPLDGQFAPNVLLQIKNGPIDFQTREATSPLFGSLESTNQLLELQVTQEYTGQQRHVCCLLPQWKEYLDFPTHGNLPGKPTRQDGAPIHKVVSGEVHHRPLGGIAAVANTGDDPNWCGHHLAQINLWGFGRLCWDPCLDLARLVDDWTRLTFGHDPVLVQAISTIQKTSWHTYESYTAPLGVGFMVNPSHHYGPNVDGYEYDRWGTYHFADRDGIGVDRTGATGTGYTGQYQKPNAQLYESLATCPDEVLLFFHHVPWTHRLHSGKTVIQHIYDTHFEGADAAAGYVETWKSLEGTMDARRHREVLERLEHQAWHAREWRDQINTYCYRKSGIPDSGGRRIY